MAESRSMSSQYFPRESARFRALLDSLSGKRVVVIGHMRPDGDCIGSQVALCRMLRAAGADAVCANGHPIPRNLRAFAGDTPFFENGQFSPDGHQAVFTDCADLERAGSVFETMFSEVAANIDHHISNTLFARENIVLPDAAAVCFMLAAFAFDCEIALDATAAQALYTGIVTDTGQFKYPSTTPEVLEVAAELLRRGAKTQITTSELYEHDTSARLALLQRFLASLKFYAAGRVCTGETRLADFAATGTGREDTEGFVDYLRCIDGVDVAVALEETSDGVKGSLRAKDERYRMDALGKVLNGGGHVLAAGFKQKGATLDGDRARLLEIITQHIAECD